MKNPQCFVSRRIIATAAAMIAVLLPAAAMAHQPRLVTGGSVEVADPEISKAYYGTLDGEPAVFSFRSAAGVDLYVNVLVPAVLGSRTDFVVTILRDGQRLAVLNGSDSPWRPFHEEFAGDDYLKGPEYRSHEPAGLYEIRVSDPTDRGRYVLAVGEKESFPPGEVINSLRLIPRLKTSFFGRATPAGFVLSIFGAASLALAMVLGALLALTSRLVMRPMKKNKPGAKHNIGSPDRLVRLVLAVILLAAGIIWWSPILQLLSGYVFFEAAASWCALYALMGRNTCPIT